MILVNKSFLISGWTVGKEVADWASGTNAEPLDRGLPSDEFYANTAFL